LIQPSLLFALAFFAPLALALALTPLSMSLAWRLGLVDRPSHRKSHQRPVPYLGGVALFAALDLALAAAAWLPRAVWPEGASLRSVLACLLPAMLGVALGLWDDLRDIRASHKFLIQGLAALAFSAFAYRIQVLHLPGFHAIILGPFLAIGVTTFFILAVVNGFNMIDGLDGLCTASSLVTLLMLAVASATYGQAHLVLLSLAGAGACLGFLAWNCAPASSYLGDAGSQGLGFLSAGMILALGAADPSPYSTAVLQTPFHYQMVVTLLLAGYPAAEVLLTVLRRGMQGRSLARADQGHLHHRMLRLGLNPGSIVVIVIAFNLFCGGIVLSFLDGQKGLAVLLSLALTALMALALQQLGFTRLLQRRWLDARRPHFAVAQHYVAMQSLKVALAQNMGEVFLLISQVSTELGMERVTVDLRDIQSRRASHHWSWTRTIALGQPLVPAEGEALGPTDQHLLNKARGVATWDFEKAGGAEQELEMDTRVLMAEFMRQAIERLYGMAGGKLVARDTREKMELGLSIQGLKGRLYLLTSAH
jgi:UDP-GlcNAc:undecaprenyl-phosphate GlcNAc-1-phosphate transferase